MVYVLILTICVANEFLAHDELCKTHVYDVPFETMKQCYVEGKFIVDKLSDQGYYPTLFCNRTTIENFNRKEITL